jgi:dCMP deaminase
VKRELVDFYLNVASDASKLSKARRLKVGAVIVKNDNILAYGWNGTARGRDNNCESESIVDGKSTLTTLDEVIHAEMNAVYKVARSTGNADGCDVFITHSPCTKCAAALVQLGAKTVFYREGYRLNDGVEFLEQCGVTVMKVD